MKHLEYARYILRHKYFVFLECIRLGILWRGLIHDLSKLLPDEWLPYASHFYGRARDERAGYDRSHDLDDEAFNIAWLKHIHRNKHHWQFWLLQFDGGPPMALPMPLVYCKEMLADWRGAGRAQGYSDARAWYKQQADKMILAPVTRHWIEDQLGLVNDGN